MSRYRDEIKLEHMSGFHRQSFENRLLALRKISGLSDDDIAVLRGDRPLPISLAENFIENVIGYFPLPLGVATHFNIDGRDVLIPMAVEETSIIAAASATAKWIRKSGRIATYAKGRLIIGQIQIPVSKDPVGTRAVLQKNRDLLIRIANECVPGLVRRGGGIQDLAFREITRTDDGIDPGKMLVIHVLCDPCDAMGANLINQVCEALKPKIEELTGERVGLCILSNLVDGRLAGAEVVVRDVDPAVGRGIEEAVVFARRDPYRAATHNKGTLNGIDPILIATGNDWRAVEAGIHTFASLSGRIRPLTDWRMEGRDLVGRIEVPMALGTAGGMTRSHPFALIALKILGAERAEDLARICAAVGLVQNLGALRALSTVGIVKGHMQLHAANLAIAAGAEVHEIPQVRLRLTQMLKENKCISLSLAREVLESIRGESGYAEY